MPTRMKLLGLGLLAVVLAACSLEIEDDDGGPGGDSDTDTDTDTGSEQIGPFEGVDLLLVVDNSGSMAKAQAILATVSFPLVNALVNPLPTWQYPAADNVRVAVVSSDMGMSWGGNLYQDGDGWPSTLPAGCSSAGDYGQFKTYGQGKTISIQNNVIPCGSGGAQCPTNWTCNNIGDDGVGVCQAPGGDGTNQACPLLSSIWAETSIENANPNLAFQVSCLSALGTSGCGFEQQLQSAAVALNRSDQTTFARENTLLAVIMVTDEEDCSIESKQLFLVPEIQDQFNHKVNIACNLPANEQYLYDHNHYYQVFQNASGTSGGTFFAAIVGVPTADACQGKGNEIGQCLSHANMQNEPILEETPSGPAWFFSPACTREEGGVEVTKARPGRRFVELAQEFGGMGYVYSICNADWSPAMQEIAKLISSTLEQ